MKNYVSRFAIILIALLFIDSQSLAQQDIEDTIDLTIEISAIDKISFKAIKSVNKGISVLDAIAQIVVLKTKNTSYGPMIVSLAGIKAEANNFWAFYVDEKMSNMGAHELVLMEDSFIFLNLESF
jgi:hypothetical protein